MATSEVVQERVQITLATESLSEERIAYLERLVSQARTAAAVFTQFTQEDVDRIVKAMVLAGLDQAQPLARLAVRRRTHLQRRSKPESPQVADLRQHRNHDRNWVLLDGVLDSVTFWPSSRARAARFSFLSLLEEKDLLHSYLYSCGFDLCTGSLQ